MATEYIMGFFSSSSNSKGTNPADLKAETFIQQQVISKRYGGCIEKCYNDYKYELTVEEKVCLAKCYDSLYRVQSGNYQALVKLAAQDKF